MSQKRSVREMNGLVDRSANEAVDIHSVLLIASVFNRAAATTSAATSAATAARHRRIRRRAGRRRGLCETSSSQEHYEYD
jgi:hypothetical protein